MSDETNQGGNQQDQDQGEQVAGVSELDMLKSRARMMNVPFSNNIGVEALREKINEKLNGTTETIQPDVLDGDEELRPLTENDLEAPQPQVNALEVGEHGGEPPKRPETLRERLVRENMYLIRCRITNLDPKKKDLPGEFFTVANEILGTVRKYIPYGEQTENGYHIPKILYEMLRNKKFLNIRVRRDRRTGVERVEQSWSPEFSLEVLDPLTGEELTNLAQAQIAAGSVENQQAG